MMWADPTPPRIASTQASSFGRMPPATPPERRLDLVDRGARDQRAAIVGVGEPAVDVGEEDRLVRGQRGRDLAGGGVGVDVVGVAVAVGAGRGDHRDVVVGDVVEHVDVDALDLADEADLARRSRAGDLEQRAVLAGEPDRRLAVAVEAHDDVGVDLAEQDHLRDLDRLGVGDAHALDEPHLHPEPLHVAGDVGAAAVDDHRVQADVLEQHDVGREVVAQRLVAHRRAAVLDHDRAPVELADVGQGLEQGLDVRGHVVYSALMPDVLVGEVGEVDVGGGLAAAEVDRDLGLCRSAASSIGVDPPGPSSASSSPASAMPAACAIRPQFGIATVQRRS